MSKRKTNNLKVSYGGIAKPLGENYFLMHGATHEQGGIGIGKDLEVENGEIVKVNPKSVKVLSNAPIMNGISPAQFALDAPGLGILKERFNTGFKYQEAYKDKHKLNDDGTKKARLGKYSKQETSPRWGDLKSVEDEIHDMMYNARDPKQLARDLQYYLDNVVKQNPNITNSNRDFIIQDLEHYIKYPYSSTIIYRDNFDKNISTKMTLSPQNISYTCEALKNLISLGYKIINLNCIFEEGWDYNHGTILYNQLTQFADWLFETD